MSKYDKQTGIDVIEFSPYIGAKPSFLIEEQVEDSRWLSHLVKLTYGTFPNRNSKRKNNIRSLSKAIISC